MKIMYLVYSFTTGGTERLLVDICNEMSKKNDVFLYIVNNYYSYEMLKQINENVTIETENRKVGSKNILKTMNNISRLIKKNKIDIVHCNSLNSPELLFISKIFYHKLKIFYTVHGMNQYKELNKIRIIYRNIICNKIIGISNSVREDIARYGANPNKTIMIYNGIQTNKFNLNNKEFNTIEPVIGNVARIEPKIKGQDILIDAIIKLKEKYPKISCILAGGIAEKDKKDYKEILKKIKKNKIENNIVFVGNIQDVPEFLKKIDIFVLPSRYEGFGLSLVEAMSMGIPCIASNLNGPAEIIEQEKVGKLFESGNANSLAKVLEEVIENFEIIKKEATHICDDIKNKYDISNMCDKLIKVYKER